MMKRLWLQGVRCATGLAAAAAILAPTAAQAQIRQVTSSDHHQAIGFTLGGFFPKGEDSRVTGDVLFRDLDDLVFEVKDFAGGSVSGEWLFALGDFVEAGVGAGFYQRTVPSVYRDVVNDNGSEIEQDLKLRMVPFTATVRFLPFGRSGGLQPYIGGGVAIINYRYSEAGEFVDFTDRSVFRDTFAASGTATGPTVLGGVRVPLGAWDFGGEVRWQRAKGDLPSDLGFAGDKIDLGGWNYLATITLHF